ncbi:MAG: hypothetical protein LQ342_006725 [Letrouitia transgressa]|nr:MAG: hypothetical protein LQ342_006725 [Letrouitia transgressa]
MRDRLVHPHKSQEIRGKASEDPDTEAENSYTSYGLVTEFLRNKVKLAELPGSVGPIGPEPPKPFPLELPSSAGLIWPEHPNTSFELPTSAGLIWPKPPNPSVSELPSSAGPIWPELPSSAEPIWPEPPSPVSELPSSEWLCPELSAGSIYSTSDVQNPAPVYSGFVHTLSDIRQQLDSKNIIEPTDTLSFDSRHIPISRLYFRNGAEEYPPTTTFDIQSQVVKDQLTPRTNVADRIQYQIHQNLSAPLQLSPYPSPVAATQGDLSGDSRALPIPCNPSSLENGMEQNSHNQRSINKYQTKTEHTEKVRYKDHGSGGLYHRQAKTTLPDIFNSLEAWKDDSKYTPPPYDKDCSHVKATVVESNMIHSQAERRIGRPEYNDQKNGRSVAAIYPHFSQQNGSSQDGSLLEKESSIPLVSPPPASTASSSSVIFQIYDVIYEIYISVTGNILVPEDVATSLRDGITCVSTVIKAIISN